jgi:molecular chaperone GrpE (heat shock protein)
MTETDHDPADRADPIPEPAELDLEERVRQAEERAEDSRNAYLRAVADLENYRKRVAREVENARPAACCRSWTVSSWGWRTPTGPTPPPSRKGRKAP